jgi:hypothetical protein
VHAINTEDVQAFATKRGMSVDLAGRLLLQATSLDAAMAMLRAAGITPTTVSGEAAEPPKSWDLALAARRQQQPAQGRTLAQPFEDTRRDDQLTREVLRPYDIALGLGQVRR